MWHPEREKIINKKDIQLIKSLVFPKNEKEKKVAVTVGIILAAGRGKRMGNLTSQKPKCYLKIKNKTLLDHIIDNFEENDIKKNYVITGYKQKIFKSKKIIKIHNKNWKNTNMLYSLNCADKILKSNNTIVVYSDIYFSKKIIKKLIKFKSNNLTIPFYKNWKKWELNIMVFYIQD